MSRTWRGLGLLLAAVATTGGAAHADELVARGEKVFKKCMACHRVGEGAKNLVGPQLNALFGRHAGTVEGYTYSPLNKHSGENGLVWSDETLVPYLGDPNAFLKDYLKTQGKEDLATGSTKMTFKLPNEDERKAVVAYLKTFSPGQ